jgi:tRNA pseudouridine38-40 synthase
VTESPTNIAPTNVKLVVEYDGTAYAGFQVQPKMPTVQGELERAIATLTGQTIRISAAGRTDTGVHASGQVVNFLTTARFEIDTYLRALNGLLPEDIAVKEVSFVELSFHSRFRARSRQYRYSIVNRSAKPAVGRQYVYHFRRRLDIEAMQQACDILIGQHDFASFAAADEDTESTVRTIKALRCERCDDTVTVNIEADAFLPRMVRNIVGTLIWVGTYKMDLKRFQEVLEARDRTLAGPTAPARGLCLTKVNY